MASFSFFLKIDERGKGKDNTFPLYMRFTHKGQREFFQTFLRARKADIIMKDGRFKIKQQVSDSLNLNIAIDRLYNAATTVVNAYKQKPQNSFMAIEIKSAFERIIRPDKKVKLDWLSVYDEFLEKHKVSLSTKKGYKTSKNKLVEFLDGKNLNIGEISPAFLNGLVNWGLDEKSYDPEYVDNILIDTRSFLKWANKSRPGIVNLESLIWRPERKLSNPQRPAVFFTKDEFKKLIEYVPELPHLDRAKDLLLMLCYTGLRVSDLYIDASEIQGGVILKAMAKTEGFARIPLMPETKAILEKYDYKLPKISDQKLNEYIKDLLEAAKIDTPTKIISYPGGVKTETIVPKYQAISTKAGRKTLVSRMISANVHEKKIRSITGHVKPLNLEPYMGVEDKDIDEALKKAFE